MQTPDTMVHARWYNANTQQMAFILGELRCCELELRNTGPVAMGSLYLLSQTPGLLSFGRRRGEEESLYDFPLIEDSGHHFRRQREDGKVEQVRTYLRVR